MCQGRQNRRINRVDKALDELNHFSCVTIRNIQLSTQTLALLRKSFDGRSSPFPGQTYSARCVSGVPRAVKRFRMTALI